MKRLIDAKLQEWHNLPKRKPLIIKGARQVGKTYSIRQFGRQNYHQVVEINFEKQLDYVQLFERTRNPKEILSFLQLSNLGVTFDASTLLFLDEIQASSHALTALKFLAEDFDCDIICSGSALGVAIATSTSYPVGYVETLEMVPFTFTEFLWALGVTDDWLSQIEESLTHRQPMSDVIHHKMNEYFKDYVIVGGMPEVIAAYKRDKSYRDALIVQRRIVSDYTNDMAKYALRSDRIKTRECYESIPIQLAKDNKKFQYKVVKEGYNSRYYESSLRWLEDSGLIIKVNRLSQVSSPLEAYVDLPAFKVYMGDTGLLVSQFDEGVIKDLLTGDLGVYKGAIYENVVAQILHAFKKKSYYFEPNTTSEIDFIIYYEGQVLPIEVKSAIHTSSVSFNNFVKKHHCTKSLRISMKNLGVSEDGKVLYIPFYMIDSFLRIEESVPR